MSEAELHLFNEAAKCTFYTIQFLSDDESEYEKFFTRFKDDAQFNPDLARIVAILDNIGQNGALERFFRYEGKMSDRVVALPVLSSKLRLYCIRLSNGILVLGNGGVKKTRTYGEDDTLRGYVLDLQKFDKLLKDGERDGSIKITESTIETDKIFDI